VHRRGHGHRDGRGGAIAIELTRAVREDIIAHARESDPAECCGLLLGAGERIDRPFRARNIEASLSRFQIDPLDHFAAIRAARASGRRVMGVYHSHPSTDATPSASDLAEASYAEYLYVIVGLRSGAPDLRIFQLEGDRFTPVSFSIVDSAAAGPPSR
jgi:proteasome lid subunit RPN8/RPN11